MVHLGKISVNFVFPNSVKRGNSLVGFAKEVVKVRILWSKSHFIGIKNKEKQQCKKPCVSLLIERIDNQVKWYIGIFKMPCTYNFFCLLVFIDSGGCLYPP